MWPARESSPATAPSPNTRPTSGTRSRAQCPRKSSAVARKEVHHGDLSPGGQAGSERDAGRPGPARTGIFRASARPERPQPAGQLRHQRPSGLAAARHVHRGAHPGHHPGHLRLPAQPGHRRPALHGQGHARPVRARPSARRWKSWRPTASRRSSSATTASRRRRSSRAPSSSTTAAARSTSPTASSSRRRTIRPRTAASSTTRPTAARPTPT